MVTLIYYMELVMMLMPQLQVITHIYIEWHWTFALAIAKDNLQLGYVCPYV